MPPNAKAVDVEPPVAELDARSACPKKPMEMVQLLVDRGVIEVPEKFIQPVHKRSATLTHPGDVSVGSHLQVPVIDMAGVEGERRGQIMAEMSRACEEWGFFQVLNHGVPESLRKDLNRVALEFYALSPEEKEVNAIKPKTTAGYGRLFENGPGATDWVDRLTIWTYGEAYQLAEPCLPPKPERFSKVVDEYAKAVVNLSIRLIEILSETLGLEPHVLGERLNTKEAGLRTSFNYYPPCPQPELVLGISSHADSGILTVLQQDGTPGLEICKDGEWVKVAPIQDALVINLGDQMQVTSNERYKSVEHRALTNRKVARLSFANFFVPSKATLIQPLPELLSDTNPPIYRPVTYGEYTQGFHSKALDGKHHVESFLITR